MRVVDNVEQVDDAYVIEACEIRSPLAANQEVSDGSNNSRYPQGDPGNWLRSHYHGGRLRHGVAASQANSEMVGATLPLAVPLCLGSNRL